MATRNARLPQARCDVCDHPLEAAKAKLSGKLLVCTGCFDALKTPQQGTAGGCVPSRAWAESVPPQCAECREPLVRGAFGFVEAIGLLCRWCLRWNRIDLLAARVT
jgi:hypothetical protein